MNPKLRHLTAALCAISIYSDLPGERVLRGGEGDPAAGGGGGGSNPTPPKTFTQDEVNSFLAKERRKYADYEDLKAKAEKIPEFERQLSELNEKLELAGKSEAEKTKLLAEKLEKQKAAELALALKASEDAKAGEQRAIEALRETNIRYGITGALAEVKALPDMMPYAVDAFRRETRIEFDDEAGKVTSVEFDGVPYADLKKAAEAWLKVRPGFAAAPAGGGGTRNPNGGAGGRSFDEMTPEQLATIGLENRRR